MSAATFRRPSTAALPPLIFIRVNSAGEVYQGTVPPIDNLGNPVATLKPDESLVFHAVADTGTSSLYSVAASWPSNLCGPYFADLLGTLGVDALKARGLWFKPPPANADIPTAVKFTFTGRGLLTSESGNRTVVVDIAKLDKINSQGIVIEYAEHYIVLAPDAGAKASFSFEKNRFAPVTLLRAKTASR